jgi:hypothetical protein
LQFKDVLCELCVYGSGCLWGAIAFLCAQLQHTYQVISDSNVVDLYDSGTGLWSTAQLSQARRDLAATSVGTVAIFAGGINYSKLLRILHFFAFEMDC